MARPSSTGGKTSKAKAGNASPAKGRKATKTKRRIASAATRAKRRPVSGPSKDLKEAREQQAATAEILKVIASSPDDVHPVFDAIAASAKQLTRGFSTAVYQVVGDMVHLMAFTPTNAKADEALKAEWPLHRDKVRPLALVLQGETVQIGDAETADVQTRRIGRARGWRSVTFTPLMNQDACIGFIACTRRETGVLADHHVELLQTFADQAVIAIENTRLFNETQEALERQTVTADILKVIASSPADVQPVFDAIAESAKRLLGSHTAVVTRVIDGVVHFAAGTAENEAALHGVQGLLPYPLSSTRIHARVARTGELAVNTDVDASDLPQNIKEFARAIGWRSMLVVPMLRNGIAIGTIGITRREAGSFDDKTIGLLKTFADQAVIAIENVRLFEAEQARTHDLTEALQQQTATAEVLKVISGSPGKIEPVFDKILASARQLCDAKFGHLLLFDGETWRAEALHNVPEAYARFWNTASVVAGPETNLGRVQRSGKSDQVADVRLASGYLARTPLGVATAELGGARTLLTVPLLKEGKVIGGIALYRTEVRPFDGKQVELLSSFADQAVIAIENARLFEAEQARTAELTEALEQQTATSEVLGVISQSLGQVEPVFQSMLANAMRICEAQCGAMFSYAQGAFRAVSCLGVAPGFETFLREERVWGRETGMGRAAHTKQPVHVVDTVADRAYADQDPGRLAAVEIGGVRTFVIVPMLKDGELIGAMSLYRRDVRAYTEKQIKLVSTFADQAVIAIENTRLFNEVQAKTRDLTEALTYQTGSANILSVIASSPTDVGPVLKAIVESTCELCEAYDAVLRLKAGDELVYSAQYGTVPSTVDAFPINPKLTAGRALLEKRAVHVHDMLSAEGDEFPIGQELARHHGHRTILSVPLLRENEGIGTITLRRLEVNPFSDKQIKLLQTFADQAVIAIGNVRLFEEVQARTRELTESLEQQTATSEVLQVISSTPGELGPVFKVMLENATRICGANFGTMSLYDGDSFQNVALCNLPPVYAASPASQTFRPHPESGLATVARTKRIVQMDDIRTQKPYLEGDPAVVALTDLAGARTLVAVPMLKDSELIGTIAIFRQEVRPFTDKQIALVSNFANQAVIAIENTRLLNETREALERQTATADILKVIASSPDDVQPVFEAIAERSNRLADGLATAVYRLADDTVHLMAFTPISPAADAALRAAFPAPLSQFNWSVAIGSGETYLIADAEVELATRPSMLELARLRGWRSVLAVPLMREGRPIGLITVTRVEPGRFDDHHVQLLRTFADQAVIAISNVELFNEVQARTRELSQSLDDLRAAQDRLVQTEKLASLGQLTAGIAHEIKNPLNFVNNFSALSAELTDELNDTLKPVAMDGKVRKEVDELTGMLKDNLEKVVQHGKRADSIVKNMLLHSREGLGERRPVDVNSLVEESLNLAYHGARAEKQGFQIRLERNFDPAAGEAELFPQEITRVLLNLISNGFYAALKRKVEMKDGYEPTLAAATKNLGDRVEIIIRDNGSGILPEVREKMFNPFFTTKSPGEGTGLGLSLSHDIVAKQHAGSIEVDTQPGEFTEFKVTLPRTVATSKAGADK